MALFFANNCKYRDCGKKFATLFELIHHIEGEHLDFDPILMEQREQQKPQHVPLSYIQRFSQKGREVVSTLTDSLPTHKSVFNKALKDKDLVEQDEETILIESEISDDSWNDEYCSETFPRYIKKKPEHATQSKKDNTLIRAKKFLCPVPGCNKRYKNINGIKYHTKNGHDIKKITPIKPKKCYKCYCGKAYKTLQGMKTHSEVHKELSLKVRRNHSMSPSARALMNNHVIRHHDTFTAGAKVGPVEVSNYMEHVTKVNDAMDENGNHNLNALNSPYSYNNSNLNDHFSDNLYLEETSNHYSFFGYRKF